MDSTLITIFVIIAAVAIVIQMLILLGFALAVRRVMKQALRLRDAAKPWLEPAQRTLRDISDMAAVSKESVRVVAENASGLSRIARARADSIDAALADIIARTRGQAERADLLIANLMDQVETTVSVWQKAVIRPIQQITAVARGVQTAMDFFTSRRRPPVSREPAHDEEMFI